MAAEWLARNTFNRNLSQHSVNRYASDMSAGNWTLTHQGIAFDDQGVLVDGQHRLAAIIKSGVDVRMMVTWGAARVGIDELRPRTAAEVIKFGAMSNWVDKKHLECAKQMVMLCSEGAPPYALSTNQLLEISEKNQDAIIFSSELFATNLRGISTAGARAVIATAYYHYDHDDLREFVSTLYNGIVQSTDRSAVIRLREQLLVSGRGFSGGGLARRSMAWKMMRAVTAFCARQPLRSIMEQSRPAFTLPASRNLFDNDRQG